MACITKTLLAGLIVVGTSTVYGQNFPSRTLRIVAPEVGGSNDQMARMIAQGIAGPLGQPVIVENRSTNIATETVLKASPDGYTLLVAGGTFWIGPLLQKMSYDPIRDFSAVTITDQSANVLFVHPSVPAKTVRELIDLAKAKPGMLNYGSGNTGSSSHLSGELFKSMAGVNIVRIPYKGNGPAINALVAGEVQMMIASNATLTSNAKAGKLRILGVGSAQPSALMPDVPTMATTIPGYEAVGIGALFVPAKTPVVIIQRLNQEIVRALNSPDVKKKLLAEESEVVGSSPEEAAVRIKGSMARFGKLIKDIGLRAD